VSEDRPHPAAEEFAAIQGVLTHLADEPVRQRSEAAAASFRDAMDRLYADPGITADEIPALTRSVLALGALEPEAPLFIDNITAPRLNVLPGPGSPKFAYSADSRIEITASFCQCPSCREARCEP
jgi:hypothetical protein